MRKVVVSITLFCLCMSIAWAYQTTKATKIVADPGKYKKEKVLVYVKFNRIESEGVFTGKRVKNIEYLYDTKDESITDIINEAKEGDLLTIKGKVLVDGFSPQVKVEGLVKDWIDTTLLPVQLKKHEIVCPKCEHVFKYDCKEEKVEEE